MKLRFAAGLAAVLFSLAGGAIALAGNPSAAPTPAPTATPNAIPTIPPNTGGIVQDAINALGNIVKSAYGWSDTEAYGTVTYYRGYEMQVRLQLDKYREIHLHRGTVINPRGWTIQTGQTVDVKGRPQSDGSLYADMIVVHSTH